MHVFHALVHAAVRQAVLPSNVAQVSSLFHIIVAEQTTGWGSTSSFRINRYLYATDESEGNQSFLCKNRMKIV